ncbi:hypothetical protein SNEBB_003304 [Seison nebaliae]|nr:hypothetical protein SNEBB_003304 [Seison nebaliae]
MGRATLRDITLTYSNNFRRPSFVAYRVTKKEKLKATAPSIFSKFLDFYSKYLPQIYILYYICVVFHTFLLLSICFKPESFFFKQSTPKYLLKSYKYMFITKSIYFILFDILFGIYLLHLILLLPVRYHIITQYPYDLFDIIYIIFHVSTLFYGGPGYLQYQTLVWCLKPFRLIEILSKMPRLNKLIEAVFMTIRGPLLYTVMLLFEVVFLFAVLAFFFFGNDIPNAKLDKEVALTNNYVTVNESADVDELLRDKNFGSFRFNIATLLTFVFQDGWFELQRQWDLLNIMKGSRYFIATYIIVAHFIFTSVIVAIIISNVRKVNRSLEIEEENKNAIIKKMKQDFTLSKYRGTIFHNTIKHYKLGMKGMNERLLETGKKLKNDIFIIPNSLMINPIWIETLLVTLRHTQELNHRILNIHSEICSNLCTYYELHHEKLKDPKWKNFFKNHYDRK